MKKIILSIEGMTCSACSNGLEKYLNKQDGIKQASVNLVMANASIEYDEKKLDIDKLNEFVKKAGFKSLGEFKEIKTESKSKKEKVKFIIFTILAIIFMYISMGHMINLPTLKIIDVNQNPIGYTICSFIFAILFIIYGFDIIKNGYKNLIHKTPNMDTLVGIGVLSSLLYSIYNMVLIIRGNNSAIHHLYFESVAMVIYFVKLGRYLDGISKDKTKEAIQKLVKITPEQATIKLEGKEKTVTIDEVHKGDIVVSKPGERISVDGEIVEGKAHLDESFITGESKPIAKGIGEKVVAGSINYDGYIEYKAEKIGKESTISEIVKLVVEASNTKAPIAKVADKDSSYFVPIVIIIAILTFIAYLILGYSFADSLIVFVTILVVACPCSLGLATPLAIVVAEGLCANNGILVKKSEILETASKINTVIFDKTGTLTAGNLRVKEIHGTQDFNQESCLALAAAAEQFSQHPVARAVVAAYPSVPQKISEFEEFPGRGVRARIGNHNLLAGNRRLMVSRGVKGVPDIPGTVVYIAYEGEYAGANVLEDTVRQEAAGGGKGLKS